MTHGKHAKPEEPNAEGGAWGYAAMLPPEDVPDHPPLQEEDRGAWGYEALGYEPTLSQTVAEQGNYAPCGSPTEHSADYDNWIAQGAHVADPAGSFALPKKKHTVRNALLVVLGVLLVAFTVAVGAIWKYMHDLDAVLDAGSNSADALALAEAKPGEPFYMLILGIDTREAGGFGPGNRSDVIVLARVDMKQKLVTLLSIPRDIKWMRPDGTTGKMNEPYFYDGASGAVKAVSELTGVSISHYLEIDISDMEEMVDALGGVEVYVERPLQKNDIYTDELMTIDAGLQTLNGKQAQVMARDRESYETSGDMHRQSNVRLLGEAIAKSVFNTPKRDLPKTLMGLAPYLHTDMRSSDFLLLAWDYVTGSSGSFKFYSGTGPFAGDLDPVDSQQWWFCYPNPEGWAKLMAVVDSGGDPSGLEYEDTQITWAEYYGDVASPEEEDEPADGEE